VRAEAAGWKNWKNDRHLLSDVRTSGKRLAKVPDNLSLSPDNRKTAIELERTIKTRKRYRSILADYLRMMEGREVEQVVYITDTAAVAVRLQRLFASLDHVVVRKKRVRLPGTAHLSPGTGSSARGRAPKPRSAGASRPAWDCRAVESMGLRCAAEETKQQGRSRAGPMCKAQRRPPLSRQVTTES